MVEAPAKLAGTQAPCSILVVDDDESTRVRLERALTRGGYQVIVAAGGREALKCLADRGFDLVVTDAAMPDLDGFDVLQRLRSSATTAEVPVLLLTRNGSQADIADGLRFGATDCLPKPFSTDQLLARINTTLERHGERSAHARAGRQDAHISEQVFRWELERQIAKGPRERTCDCVAYVEIPELPAVRRRLGAQHEADVYAQLATLVQIDAPLHQAVTRDGAGRLILLLQTAPNSADKRLDSLAQRIREHVFLAGGERLKLTPRIGYAGLANAASADEVNTHALAALRDAVVHNAVHAVPFTVPISRTEAPVIEGSAASSRTPPGSEATDSHGVLAAQVGAAILLAMAMPFLIYTGLASAGIDITPVMYGVVVAALAVTAAAVWAEGRAALHPVEPPHTAAIRYPPATACIAASYPDDTPTVIETVRACLSTEYPAPLEVILAYSTPPGTALEATLQDVAQHNAHFHLLTLAPGISRIGCLAAAFREARGEFVGVLAADQHPTPGSFTRAWRWLSHGYDAVQGHCVLRNGEGHWATRVAAVESEWLHAASLIGKSELYQLEVQGMAPIFWKTDVLRRRPRKDPISPGCVDLPTQVPRPGRKIGIDRDLIVLALGPASALGLWRQRLLSARWRLSASNGAGARSRLSGRQRLGMFRMTTWYDILPWLLFQTIPIVGYWAWQARSGVSGWLVPLCVVAALSLFGLSMGRTVFAYRLASAPVRRNTAWFALYWITSSFNWGLTAMLTRVAQIGDVVRASKRAIQGAVAPRSAAPHSATGKNAVGIPSPAAQQLMGAPEAKDQEQVSPVPPPQHSTMENSDAPAELELQNDHELGGTTGIMDTEIREHTTTTISEPLDNQSPPAAQASQPDTTMQDQPTGPIDQPRANQSDFVSAQPQGDVADRNGDHGIVYAEGIVRQLGNLVDDLSHVLHETEAEQREMTEAIRILTEVERRQDSIRQALVRLPQRPISIDQEQALRRATEALSQNPRDIVTLVELSGQVSALSAVVSEYGELRNLVERLSSIISSRQI